ncbi:MAG: cysteine desulfurase family protein [Polyangiaceae bacterium]|jgi:cysteine desulfurase
MAVYLDWNATAPPLAACMEAMAECAREAWGNPSSVHAHGRAARARVEGARQAVAELAGVDPRDVVLTSGGTEANNLALRSACDGGVKRTLLTSRLEHPSIVRVAEALAQEGRATLRFVAVRGDGRLDLEDLARACGEVHGAVLLALQAVNHETGVIQPVDEAIAIVRSLGARAARADGGTLVHIDAVQAFGRLTMSCEGADTRSLAGHKLRGPKGIGALIGRPGLRLVPVLLGGAQERGLRPGTVDPVAAAGLAVAVRHAQSTPARYAALAPLRDSLEQALVALGVAHVNGDAPRAPHVTNVSFDGWNGPEIVAALDLEGISVSSGSACSAGTSEPSPVVTAMLGDARARSAVRVSLGEDTRAEDVERAKRAFGRVLKRSSPSI